MPAPPHDVVFRIGTDLFGIKAIALQTKTLFRRTLYQGNRERTAGTRCKTVFRTLFPRQQEGLTGLGVSLFSECTFSRAAGGTDRTWCKFFRDVWSSHVWITTKNVYVRQRPENRTPIQVEKRDLYSKLKKPGGEGRVSTFLNTLKMNEFHL